MVAHGISRAASQVLGRVGPGLRRIALAGVSADLAGAVLAVSAAGQLRVSSEADVGLAALHHGKVVSGALHAVVLAVAELEEGLGSPLAANAPFGVAGEAHAEALVGSGDGLSAVGVNADGLALLEHLKATGDGVDAELLGGGAVVGDFDVEGVGVTLVGVAEAVAVRDCCCRQGEQGGEDPA